MGLFNCECRRDCIGFAVVASLIIGIITAFLTITAVIAVTPAFLWVLFGIAVVYLAVTLIAAALGGRNMSYGGCICLSLGALIAGVLGTVLFAVILLAVSFAATSVIGAIFVGLLLFFFTLLITSTACLIRCVASCSE